MKRRLRCRLGIHKWVLRQDERDSPRYHACRYCDKTMDADDRHLVNLGL